MVEKIKQWIEGEQGYDAGVEIYQRVKSNSDMDAFLLANRGAKNGSLAHGILLSELVRLYRIALQQIADGVYEPAAAAATAQPAHRLAQRTVIPVIEAELAQVNYADLPDNLKADYDRIKELSRALGGYKSALDAATTDEERKEYADLIVVTIEERKLLWDGIDAFIAENAPKKPAPKKKR